MIFLQVAFGSRHGLWKVLANKYGREFRPGCKGTSVDCLRFDNGAETGTVEIGDKIRKSFHGLDAVDEGQADGGRFSGMNAW